MSFGDPGRVPRRLARSNTADIAAYTGPMGEVVVDEVLKRLHLQDGTTMGGLPVRMDDGSPILTDTFTAPYAGALARTLTSKAADTVGGKDFGAKGDLKYLTRVISITSGSGALTAASNTWTADDVGKVIRVPGAGVAGGNLIATIASYISPTSVTLSVGASTTLAASSRALAFGTDDTVALNAALAARTAQGYGVAIELAPGDYLTTDTLDLGGWGGQLVAKGYGQGAGLAGGPVVITTFAATGDMVEVTSAGLYAKIEGIAFRSAVPRTSGRTIGVNAQGVTVRYCTLTDWYQGIELLQTGCTLERNTINQPSTAGLGSYCINVNGGYNAKILLNDMGGTDTVKTDSGIRIQNAGDIVILANQVIKCIRDLDVCPGKFGVAEEVDSIYASMNFFDYAYDYGILLDPGNNGRVQRSNFVMNWTIGTKGGLGGAGFALAGTGFISTIQITNHEAWYCDAGSGLRMDNVFQKDVTILGGTYAQNSGDGITVANGVGRFKIIGATIGLSAETSLVGNGSDGIRLVGANDEYVIQSNIILGNGGAAISGYTRAATRVVNGNIGYLTENCGSRSELTDGSGNVAFPHGLGGAPVFITASAFGGTFVHLQAIAGDATNLQFRASDAAGAALASQTITYYWEAKH